MAMERTRSRSRSRKASFERNSKASFERDMHNLRARIKADCLGDEARPFDGQWVAKTHIDAVKTMDLSSLHHDVDVLGTGFRYYDLSIRLGD